MIEGLARQVIADVKIMLMQMLCDEDDEEFVNKIIKQKIDRQIGRIKKECKIYGG